ncbi:hypothetical protein B0H14DRAFT_2558740 [Mycena olivaceomarginata]|nr:hypothetical protein B0H14DRAFT_2558740 [Mycena olivaceomarginata]
MNRERLSKEIPMYGSGKIRTSYTTNGNLGGSLTRAIMARWTCSMSYLPLETGIKSVWKASAASTIPLSENSESLEIGTSRERLNNAQRKPTLGPRTSRRIRYLDGVSAAPSPHTTRGLRRKELCPAPGQMTSYAHAYEDKHAHEQEYLCGIERQERSTRRMNASRATAAAASEKKAKDGDGDGDGMGSAPPTIRPGWWRPVRVGGGGKAGERLRGKAR